MKSRAFVLLSCTLVWGACKPATRNVSGNVFVVTKAGPSVKLGLVGVHVLPLDSVGRMVDSVTRHADSLFGSAPKDRQAAMIEYIRLHIKVDSIIAGVEKGMCGYAWEHHDAYLWPGCTSALKARWQPSGDSLRVAEARSDSLAALIAPTRRAGFWLDGLPPSNPIVKSDADGRFVFAIPIGRPVAVYATTSRAIGDKTETLTWLVKFDPGKDSTLTLSNDNLITTRHPTNILLGKVDD